MIKMKSNKDVLIWFDRLYQVLLLFDRAFYDMFKNTI